MHRDIIGIYREAFPKHLRIPNGEICKRIRTKFYECILLTDKENTVGFALLVHLNDIVHIDYLAINNVYRGQGYFGKLMQVILEKYPYLSLECEDTLVQLYSKYGFVNSNIDHTFQGTQLNFMTRGCMEKRIYHIITALVSKLQSLITEDIVKDYIVVEFEDGEKPIIFFDKRSTWECS